MLVFFLGLKKAREEREKFLSRISPYLQETFPPDSDREKLQRIQTRKLFQAHLRSQNSKGVASRALQQMIDYELKVLAEGFRKACFQQEEQRKEINHLKQENAELSAEEISGLFHALKLFDKRVVDLKKEFWEFHKLAAKLGFRVWPEYEAYLLFA
ncbi:MAG: hypothetical protein V1656_02920 [Candidatus Jorgensenbacteria bacterium]